MTPAADPRAIEGRGRRLRGAAAGVLGQGLTLVAMLITVTVFPTRALVEIVFVTSVTSAAVYSAVLAMPMIYPSIADDRRARTVLASGILSLSVVTTCLALIGITLLLVAGTGRILMPIAVLLLCQGFEVLQIAWFVRMDHAAAIAQNRLRYGIINLVATIGATFIMQSRDSLVIAACLSYVGTAAWVSVSHQRALRQELAGLMAVSLRDTVTETRRGIMPSVSYLLNGFGTNAAGLSVSALGALAGPWAVVVRIGGGFTTVSRQLIAPNYDASLSRAVRLGSAEGIRRTLRRGLWMGVPLGALGVASPLALCVVTNRFGTLAPSKIAVVSLCAFCYWGSTLLVAPTYKTLSLLAADRIRFLWDITRFCLIWGVIVVASGEQRLVALSAVVAIANVILVLYPVVLTRARAPLPGPTPALGLASDVLVTADAPSERGHIRGA